MSTRSGIRIRPQTTGIRHLPTRLLGRKIDGALVPAEGRALWLRADDLAATLSDTDPVTAWADRDGNGKTFSQGTEAAQPTWNASTAAANNHATISFVTDDYLEYGGTIITQGGTWSAHTVFAVGMGSAAVTGGLYSEGDSAYDDRYGLFPRHNSGGTISYRRVWVGIYRHATTVATVANDTFFIGHAHASLFTVNNMYLNGGSEATEGTGNTQNGYDIARIGARAALTPTDFLSGDIAEVLVYQSALSAEDVTTTLNYLAGRYSITLDV